MGFFQANPLCKFPKSNSNTKLNLWKCYSMLSLAIYVYFGHPITKTRVYLDSIHVFSSRFKRCFDYYNFRRSGRYNSC